MSALKSSLATVEEALAGNGNAAFGVSANAAAAPYKMVDRRASYGWNNTLIESATQTQDRGAIQLVDYDFHRTLSVIGRRTLLSLARAMYWRIPPLQACILEQANLAVSPFTPIYRGRNKAWGEAASEWLEQFHSVMDLAGWPFDYASYNEIMIVNSIVDGDVFTLLTEDASGNPRVQIIPSHRVGSRYQTGGIVVVKYNGRELWIDGKLIDDSLPWEVKTAREWEAPIIDGVILDDLGRPLAYRVYVDPVVSSEYEDISARNLFPAFLPVIPGQVRNVSLLASSVFDWQDVREFRRFEMLAQKVFSSKTIVEQNETGDVDTSKAVISQSAQFDPTTGNKTTPDFMQLAGGAYHYFKAGSGSKLEAFDWGNRPGRDAQAFQESTVRDAFKGTEWDVFFSLDPKHVGGAALRVITDRVNRVVKKRRRLAGKNILRVDCYALAKAMKNGELPMDADWYKWGYQGPPDVTADRRYDAQTDQMEYQMGWSTMEDIESRRNGDWRIKRQQKQMEVEDLYARAAAIVKQHPGLTIQEVAAQLSLMGTSSLSVSPDAGDGSSGGGGGDKSGGGSGGGGIP